MPRDIGTGLYHYPAGTEGNTAQTIFSARYNTFINDLANTLNQALPINMGGTDADNATEARDNLDAERAGAQVTNYNTHVWENGSFWSAGGTTGEPVAGHGFVGTAIIYSIDWIVLEARDLNDTGVVPGRKYIRQKTSGTWGAWTVEAASQLDGKVDVAGDTMTGDLTIGKTDPRLILNGPLGIGQPAILGSKSSLNRWATVLGDTTAEGGTSDGSDFTVLRYNNAGAFIDTPFSISRSTGIVTLIKSVAMPAGFTTGSANVKFLWDGTNLSYSVNGGVSRISWDNINSPTNTTYQKFASGIILQWGTVGSTGSDMGISFPIVFPSGYLTVTATMGDTAALASTALLTVAIDTVSVSGFVIRPRYALNGGTVGVASNGIRWYAVGF